MKKLINSLLLVGLLTGAIPVQAMGETHKPDEWIPTLSALISVGVLLYVGGPSPTNSCVNNDAYQACIEKFGNYCVNIACREEVARTAGNAMFAYLGTFVLSCIVLDTGKNLTKAVYKRICKSFNRKK